MLKPLLGMYVAFIVTTLSIVLYRYFMMKYKFNAGVRSFFGYTEKIPLIGLMSIILGVLVSVVSFSWGRFNTIIIILSAIVIFIQSTLSREGRINLFASFIIKSMLIILIANHIYFNTGMNEGSGFGGMLNVLLLSLFFLASSYAYYLLDESEGLVSRIFSINMAVIGLVSLLNNNISLTIGSFAFCGSSLALARFNSTPSRFISGHSGAESLGFILSVMLALCCYAPNGNTSLSSSHLIVAIGSSVFLPVLVLIKKLLFLIDNNLTANSFFAAKGILYGINPISNRKIVSLLSLVLVFASMLLLNLGIELAVTLYLMAILSVLVYNFAMRYRTAIISIKVIPASQKQNEIINAIQENADHKTEILIG